MGDLVSDRDIDCETVTAVDKLLVISTVSDSAIEVVRVLERVVDVVALDRGSERDSDDDKLDSGDADDVGLFRGAVVVIVPDME